MDQSLRRCRLKQSIPALPGETARLSDGRALRSARRSRSNNGHEPRKGETILPALNNDHSDIRLKEAIVRIARLDNGIGLYRFRYGGGGRTFYVGVMAQEVQTIMPEAVARGRDGHLLVDYDRVGLPVHDLEAVGRPPRRARVLRERRVRSNKTGALLAGAAAIVAGFWLGLADARAQDGSAKAIFEKYSLLGTFAWDCSKPPSAQNNWYHVHRLIDPDHVQRDYMTGPTTRQWLSVIDQVAELRPDEVELSGTITGRVGGRDLDRAAIKGIWRVQPGRLLVWEATINGDKVAADGRLTANGFQLQWSNRCGG
jgi:hypothetical protein